jgi:predicted porin/outer membrane murein-binding lipoprotein Lpp
MTLYGRYVIAPALALGFYSIAGGVTIPVRAETLQQQIEELRRLVEQQQATILQLQRRLESLQEEAAQTRETATQAREEVERQQNVLAGRPLVASGNPRIKLSISGHVNRIVNLADDGNKTKGYFVDNNLSVSRVRFVGEGQVTDDFSIGSNIELGISPNNSNDVSQFNESSGDKFDQRKVEALFTSKTYGKVSFGKGDAAAKDISKVDLSGTDVLAYSAVQDVAGGLFFINNDNNASSGIQVKNAFTDLDSSRISRVRYDTPKLMGASLAVSAGEDQRYDAALRWSGEVGEAFKTAAGIGIFDPSASGVNYRLAGSASVLHTPTGLSLTGAAGRTDADSGGRDTEFAYLKGGWQVDFFRFGKTAFSIDWQRTEDGAAKGDTGDSCGFAAVQNLKDYGTEFYAGLRTYDLDRDNGPSVSDIIVGTFGTRVKF